jgi:exopolyphosphatase/pppGpp-phosphohydrolase
VKRAAAWLALLLAALVGLAGDVDAGRGGRRPRAAIDIGSSGIKLLVTDRKGRVVVDEKIGASLGKAIGADRLLPRKNQKRARRALERLVARAEAHGVPREKIEVVATAAVRNADGFRDPTARSAGKSTGSAFMKRVVRGKQGLGLRRARILTDHEEAILGYQGVIRGRPVKNGERLLVIDTGGGSHQVVAGAGKRILAAGSTQIGSNQVSEKVLIDAAGAPLDAASPSDLAAADRRIAKLVTELPIGGGFGQGSTIIVTGGVSKFLYHHFRKSSVTRAELEALRQRVAGVPASKRGRILKRDVTGARLSRREKELLGLHKQGSSAGSYGRKLPAKLTLLLRLMTLAGGATLELSQTDARHLLGTGSLSASH